MGIMKDIGRLFGPDEDKNLPRCDSPDVNKGEPCQCPRDGHTTTKGSPCDRDRNDD